MKTIALLAALLILSGCAGGVQPVTDEMFNEAGEIVQVTTKYVADASVAKEESVHKTLRARDRAIVQDGKNSGMKMEWTTVEETIAVPGQAPIVMKRAMPVISFKERGRFDQKLPTEPSVHPGYKMTSDIVGKVVNGTVIGLGITAGADVLKSALGSAGDKQTVTAETANMDNNSTTVSNTGNEAQVTATGTAEPVIVEPIIFDAGAVAEE